MKDIKTDAELAEVLAALYFQVKLTPYSAMRVEFKSELHTFIDKQDIPGLSKMRFGDLSREFQMDAIKTDRSLVAVIDDVKHYLKAGMPLSRMRADFNDLLNRFIADWNLDSDQHSYVCLPEDAKDDTK